jgi:S-DNA-T family DNA segregation ATPase FtsK/SpoIIIE
VHGPFVSDEEVERVVAHLKRQAKPVYLEEVTPRKMMRRRSKTSPPDDGEAGLGSGEVYDQAVSIVLRHKKASTSYIQRRLQIGYNRAASIMERMEKEGVVGPANHAGKREILIGPGGIDED